MRHRVSIPSRMRLALGAAFALFVRPVSAASGSFVARDPSELLAAVDIDDETDDVIPLAWLDHAITVEQAEAAHPGITDDRIRRFPEAARPFGFENARWEAFKARMQPGDVLWSFASPAESWEHLSGRAGVAIVRNGKVLDALVTTMN